MRGADVFVVQSHYEPINEALMEQVIIIDAMKRASAKRITAVVPYYGYSRQDKKTLSREPISAKLIADMLRVAGADRIVSVDLHSGQIQGYFDGPFDHLTALPLLSTYLKDELGLSGDDLVVVAPDAGRIKTSEKLREYLHADLAYIYKRRSRHEAHKISEMRLVYEEDIAGRPCVMVDDMIDTAGTLVQGVNVLAAHGRRPDLRRRDARDLLGEGAPDPGGGADRAGDRDEHGPDPRGEAVLKAAGALDRAARRLGVARGVRRTRASARSSAAPTRSSGAVPADRRAVPLTGVAVPLPKHASLVVAMTEVNDQSSMSVQPAGALTGTPPIDVVRSGKPFPPGTTAGWRA